MQTYSLDIFGDYMNTRERKRKIILCIKTIRRIRARMIEEFFEPRNKYIREIRLKGIRHQLAKMGKLLVKIGKVRLGQEFIDKANKIY